MGNRETSIPDEDEKEVQAHEKPEDAGHQEKEQGEELLDPQVVSSHMVSTAGEKNDAGQQQHGQAETVHRVEVGDAQRANPGDMFDELKAAALWS